MAKHWSTDVFVLCWKDENSNGRKRMSWDTDRDRLCRTVAQLSNCVDPVLYNGFGSRLTISVQAQPEPTPKKKRKGKGKANKLPTVAAA